jgi:PKD repeat protein
MASKAVQWILVLLIAASGSVLAQITPVQACSVTTPNGPPGDDRPPILNPNLDFHWSCEQQGQRCIFVPDILNPALKADLKYFDWSWGTNPPVTWRRYKIQEVRYDYPVLDYTYLVTLTATFHTGQVEVVAKNVHVVVAAPSAYFAYNNIFYGLSLHLETPIGDPTTHRYYWDFGDGTTAPYGPYKCFCKTYERPGQYKVTLTVLNRTVDPPTEVSFSRFIEVPNLVPEATFAYTSNVKTFTFDAGGSRDEPPFDPVASAVWAGFHCDPCTSLRSNAGLTFDWDFGDGSFGTGMNATHDFTIPGTHVVRLTATDGVGAIGTFSKTVTVPNDPPVAALDFSCTGRSCRFDASRSKDDGGIQSYQFNFGDGSAPVVTTEPYVTRTFTADNYYTVTVTANDGALQSTASRVTTINADFQSPSLFYFTTEPCRIFDSRLTPPALTSGVTRTIPVAGKCQIPYTALAVAANVTAVTPNAIGYLRTFRPGDPVPIASVLNWTPDRAPRSNNITVAMANDSINVQPILFPAPGTTGTTELVVDVVGFYSTDIVPFAGPKGPLMFQSLPTPCRIFDSRSVPGSGITNPNPAYLKVAGKCGIPADLGPLGAAAALNLAVIGASSDGSVTVYPSSMAAPPNTTTVNFRSAVMNHANAVNASLGLRPNDDIAMVYSSAAAGATTQYAIDTSGYFSDRGTQYFHPIRPCRAVDTRRPERGETRPVVNVTQDFQIRGNCGVPASATAVLANPAVIQPDGGGNLLLWPSATTPPVASTVNFTPGENAIANTVIVPLGTGLRDLSARMTFSAGHLAIDVFGYFTSSYSGARAPVQSEER